MIWNKLWMVRWFAVLGLSLSWVAANGCTQEDDNQFSSDDDDDDNNDDDDDDTVWDGCPGSWFGIPEGEDPKDSPAIALMAEGGENFSIPDRNFHSYTLRHYYWREDAGYDINYDTGFCFDSGAGLFQGDESSYGENLYSVSVDLESEDGWAGTIQVFPIAGQEPYPLGERGSVRGLAIEGDGEDGFLVCGSTHAGGENSIIRLDDDGVVTEAFPLDEGDCYDLSLGLDGTYWVTDKEQYKVYNFDLSTGEFDQVGDLPGADAYTIEQYDDDTLYVGAFGSVWSMDIGTGQTTSVASPLGVDTNGHTVSAMRWSDELDRMTVAFTGHDNNSNGFHGPNMSWVYDLISGSHPQGLIATNREGEILIDYLLWDLSEYAQ